MKTLPSAIVLNLALGVLFCTAALAQKSDSATLPLPPQTPITSAVELAAKVPSPAPEDVKTMDGILHGIYDVVSGPAGERNWKRFRSLFLPQARFTQVGKDDSGNIFVISWGMDEFIRDASQVFAKQAFYESAIVNQPETYGNMTQVFSSYESRNSLTEKPFQRGINSIQLLNDGKRWWVVSIFWDSERPDNPLPAKFAGK
jgi:hypothetical protein